MRDPTAAIILIGSLTVVMRSLLCTTFGTLTVSRQSRVFEICSGAFDVCLALDVDILVLNFAWEQTVGLMTTNKLVL